MALSTDTFKQKFSGEVVLPEDAGYEGARNTFMGKGRPALIVVPKTTVDVTEAQRFAKENELIVSVRSGGHSGAGFSTNNDGIVIDMQHFNAVELLDADKRLVRVGSGGKWKEVAEKLQEKGLAVSSGDTGSVGVGGLTLGGGIGWIVRKNGMTIDHLHAAEVVTASGEVLRVSADEHPDLFWAVRGGGGNFGIVTNFEFIAQPIGKVYFGNIVYPPDQMASLLKGWRDHMRQAPLELNSMFLAMPSFGGNPPSAVILCCYAGDDEKAASAAFAPLRKLGTPLADTIALKNYADTLDEAHPPQGMKIIASNVFVPELSDEIIDLIAAQKTQIFQIRSLGGAMNKVAPDATAFPHRNSEALIVSPTFFPPDVTPEQISTGMIPWNQIAKFGKGMYGNLLSENTITELKGTYLDTYARLAEIKKIYDPENLFTQNFNVKPM